MASNIFKTLILGEDVLVCVQVCVDKITGIKWLVLLLCHLLFLH